MRLVYYKKTKLASIDPEVRKKVLSEVRKAAALSRASAAKKAKLAARRSKRGHVLFLGRADP